MHDPLFRFYNFRKVGGKKNEKNRKKRCFARLQNHTQKIHLYNTYKNSQYVNFTQVSEICPLTSLFLLLLPSFLKEPCMCSAIHLTLTSNIPVSMTSCVRRRLHGTSHTTCRWQRTGDNITVNNPLVSRFTLAMMPSP